MNKDYIDNFDAFVQRPYSAAERIEAAFSFANYKLNLGKLLTFQVFSLEKWGSSTSQGCFDDEM